MRLDHPVSDGDAHSLALSPSPPKANPQPACAIPRENLRNHGAPQGRGPEKRPVRHAKSVNGRAAAGMLSPRMGTGGSLK